MPDRPSAAHSTGQDEDADGYFAPLASARYLLLTTFTPAGIPASATVRGVVDGDLAYFRAWTHSAAAKNLRHDGEVQVAPGTALGLRSRRP